MNASSFSGFSTVFNMEALDVPSLSPVKSPRHAFNSPVLSPRPTISIVENLKPLSPPGEVEPILTENPNRFTLFPIQKPKLYQKYKNHVSVFWTVEEIDLAKDLKDWVKLSVNEQYFIKNVLAFFAGSDGIVQENLAARFMREIQLPEARNFYSVQMMIEAIHSEMYSLLIDTYIEDKEEKQHLFKATETVPCVKLKADWAKKWIESPTENFATRLVAFAVVEGIFFSGSFCAIYWLKERGRMP